MTQEERFTEAVLREETCLRARYNAADPAYRADVERRALAVYFRFRAIHGEWVEENAEPSGEAVLDALWQARESA